MLSRRKVFSFLAASPVVAVGQVAQATQLPEIYTEAINIGDKFTIRQTDGGALEIKHRDAPHGILINGPTPSTQLEVMHPFQMAQEAITPAERERMRDRERAKARQAARQRDRDLRRQERRRQRLEQEPRQWRWW